MTRNHTQGRVSALVRARWAAMIVVAVLLVGVSAAATGAVPPRSGDKVDVLIGFRSDLVSAQAEQLAGVRQLGGEIRRQFTIVNAVAARMTPQAAEALARNPAVRYVEPDAPVYALGVAVASATQTVPWGVGRVFGGEAYPFSTWESSTGLGVAVAVLDTGIDETHPGEGGRSP